MKRRTFLSALAGAAVAATAAKELTNPARIAQDLFHRAGWETDAASFDAAAGVCEQTLTCSSHGFEVGDIVEILAGTGRGQTYRVTAVNDRSTLTISPR